MGGEEGGKDQGLDGHELDEDIQGITDGVTDDGSLVWV
jgi:hypothetical protein